MQHHSFVRNLPPLFINLSYKQAQNTKHEIVIVWVDFFVS